MTIKPRPEIVVLGAGWGGFQFARRISKKLCSVTVVSPRNHFLFTPLLASTTVGTLEFRAIIEPVRTIPGVSYLQANALSVDHLKKVVTCQDMYTDEQGKLRLFDVEYDKLVCAVGALPLTFGIPGVREHAFFLKELSHARAIRQRILECFEHASNPALTEAEKKRLLHFAVVGGGPTSVEFAAELYDFISEDVRKWFPESKEHVRITLVEAGPVLLNAFDKSLSDYALKLFTNRNIQVLTGSAVKEVKQHELVLKDGRAIPCGIVVWSTGVSPGEFVTNSNWVRDERSKRIKIDGHLRVDTPGVLETESVFAIGDCSIDTTRPSPCTAQAAAQEATYLAKTLSKLLEDQQKNRSLKPLSITAYPPFQFSNVGMLAYLGDWKGLADLKAANIQGKGLAAWLFWRSAYWTMNVSITNKILIPMYWFKSWLFGRDISRF
eukprot:TRINITY_DN4459_c0_g1_i1.p1 TRINITY_DN4459_c0_g1~~TRINITY_DN4459_c0_g1_i1.p1  ORF type:complete len:455 (-),score=107.72 TRINITY_DN4459_c0_g1_i1:74-1384(-)